MCTLLIHGLPSAGETARVWNPRTPLGRGSFPPGLQGGPESPEHSVTSLILFCSSTGHLSAPCAVFLSLCLGPEPLHGGEAIFPSLPNVMSDKGVLKSLHTDEHMRHFLTGPFQPVVAVEVTGFPILKRGGPGSRRVGVSKSRIISFFPFIWRQKQWDKAEPLQIHEKTEVNRSKKKQK